MYILKVKGKAKIPDYIQLRDREFTLLGYFRVDRPEKGIIQAGLEERKDEIIKLIKKMPYGTLHKIDLQ